MPPALTYADWLARGRTHQWEGRPLDAIPCFERAARLEPRSSEAAFYLGEVRWQLGQAQEAVAAWREAAQRAPGYPPPRVALAEALLFVGDEPGAHVAALQALAIAPDEHRARVIAAVSTPVDAANPIDLAALATLAGRDAAPFTAPPIAQALARRWNAHPDATGSAALASALAPHVDSLPWSLLVPLARNAFAANAVAGDDLRAALMRTALERSIGPADVDALRQLARIASGDGDPASATAIAARYAGHCVQMFTPAHPLVWPRRTAGNRLRVAALAPPDLSAIAALLADACATLRDGEEWTLWIPADAATNLPPLPAAFGAATVRIWPASPDISLARAIALGDPDLLIDGIGLEGPIGPVVAAHPARALVPLARLPLPPPLEPVRDRDGAVNSSTLVTELARYKDAIAMAPACPVTAAELRAAWEEAVRIHQAGDGEAARTAYDRLLELQPGYAPAHFLRGALLRDAGDKEGAERDFVLALTAAPDYVEARVAAMRLASGTGDIAFVRALAEQGLARAPHPNAVLLRTLGEAELAHRDHGAAMAALRHALALVPTDPDTHYNLGVAAQMRGDLAEAARAYQRALVLSPDHVSAHFNMGVLLQEQDNVKGARTAYENVIARDPKRAAAYKNLGEALLAAGEIDAFFENFRRFEAACPDSLSLAVQALEVCQFRGDFVALDRFLEGLRHERFKAADEAELVDCLEQLLYIVLFFDVEPEMVFRLAQTYDASAPHAYGKPLPRPAERVPGPLRVGYLSGDLRNHVMGKMMWQALQYHDRERFQPHFYSTSKVRDDWTAHFAGIAHAFVGVAGMSEREAAERIAADDLDILVDLSTHTRGAKPGILAFKPARVQITHVASAGTVGLSTIDFKLTDRYADVPESEAQQIEPFLTMEGCVYPYRHIEPASVHAFHRGPLGIAATDVVIGTFVAPLKLSRRCLGLWREVLASVPNAKLAFSPLNPALRGAILRLAASGGIPSSQLVFLPQGRDDAENQARYSIVDFVLDPMPFGGVNGVLEPLDMGVPVVTLLGKRHGERTAYSILANLGVTQTVAQTGSEYVAIAVRLATDSAFAASVRAAIRAGLAHSPLVDMRAHTRHLEAAYVEALARNAPDALDAATAVQVPS